jgi:hypothetical protein
MEKKTGTLTCSVADRKRRDARSTKGDNGSAIDIGQEIKTNHCPTCPFSGSPGSPTPADVYVSQIFGLVANMDRAGGVIHWQRARCGTSEAANSVIKGDFAAGQDLEFMIDGQRLRRSSIFIK